MNFRRLLQFRLPTLLVAVAVVCLLLVANTRPSESISLGHVSSDDPRLRPGLWIMGNEFGWPWTWKVESFKGGLLENTPFDGINRRGLIANALVGLLIVGGAMTLTELALWGIRRWRATNRSGGTL